MKVRFIGFLAGVAIMATAVQGMAGVDHSEFVKGPFQTGPDVTKACLECHEKQAGDFIKTPHWTWKGPSRGHVAGLEKSDKEYGKANLINNFCTSVQGGPDGIVHSFCTKCHAGYGWVSTKYDFNDKGKVDCLVCHAQKGDYNRVTGGEVDEFSDLTAAAESVALPSRKNCGFCHFYGGGGDAVKHGDLDSSLTNPSKSLDVHMGTKESGGQDMTCVACHKTKDHRIAGASTMTVTSDGRVECEDCHTGKMAPHQHSRNGLILNKHIATVACQTCHIPYFARGQATKMSWDWSNVGKNLKVEDQYGKECFVKFKGTFTWGKDVVPNYAWYDGKIEHYLTGQKIKDPCKPVYITRPVGSIADKKAKIYPFKLFTGMQPMDAKYKYLNIFQTYKGLWDDYNWQKALVEGAEGSGLPYSGKYQFVGTVTYILQSHQVAPKEQALACGECHMGGTRMNWQALGYKGDPMRTGGRFERPAKKMAKN